MSPESPMMDDIHALAAAGRIIDTESLMRTPPIKEPLELSENPEILVPTLPLPPPPPPKTKQKSRKSRSTSCTQSLRTPPIPNNMTSLSGRTKALRHQHAHKLLKHPYYEPIKMNMYVAPKKIHRDEIQLCQCQRVVGVIGCKNRKCTNVRNHRECPPNCTLGLLCANKKFTKLKQPRCTRFRTENRGYGVKAAERVLKGTFICEYVGEVIDNDEKRRRQEEYQKIGYPPDYFMIVDDDRIIDATAKGNLSRFINHSCDPNAELQSWTVDGVKRIGVFARKNISPGEEITFNYGPSYHHVECHCGAPSCTGWINGYTDP